MHKPAATLEEGPNRAHHTQPPRGTAMKFAYPSGSRPLEGYTIKRGIGVGGFGEVYFATSDAGKEVALKRIQRNLDVELRGVTQCLNLKHVNLISLWDIRYDDHDVGWVVMEYVAGESLSDVIDRNPNGMPLDEVRSWFRGIADGVTYLHDHGIVHRDLKPGNIFEDDHVVKIGDYGLSKFISCSRRSGQTESVGTFHYMAPEIGRGVYGKEIDVYALGIILYEMLTGRVPFDGESSQEIIMKHLTSDPDLTNVPRQFQRVIRTALAKDPDLRYSTVTEMFDAFNSDGTAPTATLPLERKSAMPPVRPFVIKEDVNEPFFISDNHDHEIVMGDVSHVVTAEEVVEPRPGPAAKRIPPSQAKRPEEPIARAVRSGWRRLGNWWNTANFSTPVKTVLLVVGAIVIVMNAEWLVPIGVVLGVLYLVYFGVRTVVLVSHATPKSAGLTSGESNGARFQSRREHLRQQLRSRPHSERLTELTGSLLLSAGISAVLGLLMMTVGRSSFENSIQTWSFYAWLVLTSTAGAWTVLSLGKFWEASRGEQIRRRVVLLVAGLVLGALAFGIGVLLHVHLPHTHPAGSEIASRLTGSMYAADGTPMFPAYLVYFAGLFVLVRWWRQTDPVRKNRLSIWATAVCALWAALLDVVCAFPQPWGIMLAATISIAVQLSAPWVGRSPRVSVRQQVQQV